MKSIAFKLWLGMMALVCLVLALLWVFQIVFLENFYNNIRISQIEKQCETVLELKSNGEEVKFESAVDMLAAELNGSAKLMDMNQNILYFSGSTEKQILPFSQNETISNAIALVLTGTKTTTQLEHPRFNNTYTLIGIPSFNDGKQTGAFFIMFPLTAVEQTADILKEQLFIIVMILLFASVILSYLLSRSFTNPIKRISQTALNIGEGDFSARIVMNRKDEIGQLAQTINRMSDALSHIEQLRKDLISNVSHEIRTPLSLIKGYAETLLDVTGNNAQKREQQLGIIIEEANHLNTIVNDILDLSQIQAGYLELNISMFEIKAVIEDIIKSYGIMAQKSGVSIHMSCESPITVKADEARIRQVLHNLLSNAFRHTPSGGEIHILAQSDSDVLIKVSDTGEGIEDKDLPLIWDRFYKANQSGSKNIGTGLGLSIVKSILEAHGFPYGVESKIGYGSTFWFKLISRLHD